MNKYYRIQLMRHQDIMKKNNKTRLSKWRKAREMNPSLKKTQLQNMNGELVWGVSSDHDGQWGIVISYNETVIFLKSDGVYEEDWFGYNYIFRYKKEIRDYTALLEKYGLKDE